MTTGVGPRPAIALGDAGTTGSRVGAVFDYLARLLDAADAPVSWRRLLQVHLDVGRRQAEAALDGFPCIDLPMLVHAAMTGEETAALPVAAACALVYLGADLFDNLADQELPEEWTGWRPSQVNLAAATMLAPLPQLALSGLAGSAVPAERIARLSATIAETLFTMAVGQHEDLLFAAGEGLSPEACRRVAERKAGGEMGGFARAGAILGGATPAVEDAYAAFGSAWGTGSQIASDLADLWEPIGSRDLLNGTRTLPIVHALTVLRGKERAEFEALLKRSQRSPEHHADVRSVLRAAGSVAYTLLVVQVYSRRAMAALDRTGAAEPARADLLKLLRGGALLRSVD